MSMVTRFYFWAVLEFIAKEGHLTGGIVVATVMSNLDLEKALRRQHGIEMIRTPVGDNDARAGGNVETRNWPY